MHVFGRLTYLFLSLLVWCWLASAHDVRPVDQNQTLLVENEAEEALLKMHFAMMADSRQRDTTGRQNEMQNMSSDMSKEEFALLVGKISEEVGLLRRQALTLSKAYQALLVKHKETLKQLSNKVEYPAAGCPVYDCDDRGLAGSDHLGYAPKPITTHPSPSAKPITPDSPNTCNCNCQFPSAVEPITKESNVVGNKYYYFNYVQYPKYGGGQRPSVEPPQPQNQYTISRPDASTAGQSSGPVRPSYVDQDDPDGRPTWFGQTPQRPKVRPLLTSSSLDKKIAALEDLEQRLDQKTERWKQSFFDKHGLGKVEKLYTGEEVHAMFDQWLKKNGKL